MKNILVPTDFSVCASYAIEAGLAMAKHFDATLHLLHVVNQLDEGYYFDSGVQQQAAYQHLLHKTDLLFDEWVKKAKAEKVQLTSTTRIGEFQNEIALMAKDQNIDLIVMGSHGASGKKEFFIGSNTQKTVRNLHLPILIVKEPLSNFPFQNVVFASSFDLNERAAFKKFVELVKPFQPSIHLLSINVGSFFNQPFVLVKEAMESFKPLAQPMEVKMHFYKDYTVDAGIRHMSTSIDADLVGISNNNRHPLKRIFNGSNVEALVNHSKIAVLSIDGVFNEAATSDLADQKTNQA